MRSTLSDYEEEADRQFEASIDEVLRLLEPALPFLSPEILPRIQDVAEFWARSAGSTGAFIDPTG